MTALTDREATQIVTYVLMAAICVASFIVTFSLYVVTGAPLFLGFMLLSVLCGANPMTRVLLFLRGSDRWNVRSDDGRRW